MEKADCVEKLSVKRQNFFTKHIHSKLDAEHNKRLENLCDILYGTGLPETVVSAKEEDVELFRSLIHLWFNSNSVIEDIYHVLRKSGLCFLHKIKINLSSTPQLSIHKHIGKQTKIRDFVASKYKPKQIDDCGKNIAIPISLEFEKTSHANLLFVNITNETDETGRIIVKSEYFEPHGSQFASDKDKTLILKDAIKSLVDQLFPSKKYKVEPIVQPIDHCPNIKGLQQIVSNSYFEGSCAIFTILYAILKLLNPEYEQRYITERIYDIFQKNENPVLIIKIIINALISLLKIEKRSDGYYIINDGKERKITMPNIDEKYKNAPGEIATFYNKIAKGSKKMVTIDFPPTHLYKTYVGIVNEFGQMVKGTLNLKSGDVYEGYFNNGERTGKGIYYWKSGNVYTGDFNNGERTGKGILRFVNEDKYEGDFLNGKLSGKGIYYWKNKDEYEGDFIDGKRSGKGIMRFADGDEYEGDFINGERTGKGIMHFADGDEYEGDFFNDERTGNGIMRFADGDEYEGDFINGEMTGKGIMHFADGDEYEGDFINDDRTGKGIMRYSNGDEYEGDFIDGEKSGNGIMRYSNGDEYEGDFIDDDRSGNGILRSKNDILKTLTKIKNAKKMTKRTHRRPIRAKSIRKYKHRTTMGRPKMP
jgi:hypothetical protein